MRKVEGTDGKVEDRKVEWQADKGEKDDGNKQRLAAGRYERPACFHSPFGTAPHSHLPILLHTIPGYVLLHQEHILGHVSDDLLHPRHPFPDNWRDPSR